MCIRDRRSSNEILLRCNSILITFTSIRSPNCGDTDFSRLIGMSPFVPTPISTNVPKWVTFCTLPEKIKINYI